MRKLVLKSFRGRKRELRISIVMLTIAFLCGMLTILFLESFYRSKESLRYDTYGAWTGAVLDAKEETEQFIKQMESTKQVGKIVILGSSWNNGKRFGSAGIVDKRAQELGRLKLVEGDFPTNVTEAAVSEILVNRLPDLVKVGDQMEIALGENGEVKSYTLTGIVKAWGKEWEMEEQKLPNVLLGEDETLQGETCLLFQNENKEEWSRIQTHIESLGEGTYVYNDKAYPLEQSVLDQFFQEGKFVYFIVLIALILICYLIALTLKSRRYSLTVLRGLGADFKEVLQIVLWETLFIWAISFIVSIVLGAILSGAALYAVHVILKMQVHLEIQKEFLTEYMICVTVLYFICNLAFVLTIVQSQIRTTFRSDSGLLDRSTPPKLKQAKQLSFFTCLKRKWIFYRRVYIGRVIISIVVMAASSVCLQYFAEAKNKYEKWAEAVEYTYIYDADQPETGLTEEQIQEIESINGVKSVEKQTNINCGTMWQNVRDSLEIQISSPAFLDSEYVDIHRKYTQRSNGISVDKEGNYFSIYGLYGISSRDEERLSSFEKWADDGIFDRNQFLAGEECVLILSPYQIRDAGFGNAPHYVNFTPKDNSKKIYTYEMNEHEIVPGDIVKVTSPWGAREIRVGAVITDPDADLDIAASAIEVSEKFINLLVGFEEPRYMSVTIHLDETMDVVRTGKEIEGYFETLEQGGENLSNVAGKEKGFAQDAMFEGAEYLFVLTAVWLLYMLIMYHGNQAYLKNEGKRIGILRAHGMDKVSLQIRYLLENILESVVVILLSFLVIAVEFLVHLKKLLYYDSWNMFMYALDNNPEVIQNLQISLVIAMLVFVGVSTVTLYLPLKTITARDIIENLGNGE